MEKIEQLKKEYAKLVVKSGLNIQKGQRLAINSPVECAEFARLCVAAAYEEGCREVIMKWNDDEITRLKFLYADEDVFDEMNVWESSFYNTVAEEGAAWLSIYAENPENLKGVNSDRIKRSQITRGNAIKTFLQKETRNEFPWCVCSVPTKAWANAVFPEVEDEDARIQMLWEAIFDSCRIDEENSFKNWTKHTDELARRVEVLNSYNFKTLHYKNSIGTDLVVELPEDHYWAGGEEKTAAGIPFNANIPTEEVFTLPKKDAVNGVVHSAMPLCLNGTIVDDFYFVVKDGKIVEAHAAKGEEILKDAISVDEGASYFGEVALVPYDSPISNSKILFLNSLYDENAACHIAFGEAYPCIKGAASMSEEELKLRGVNESMTHVDFMIGTADMSIVGTTHDGKEIAVFVDGNFAI